MKATTQVWRMLLAAAVAAALAAVAAPAALAETSGDWTYAVTGGKATITGYGGSGGAVTIPAGLPDGGGTAPVVAIGDGAFQDRTLLTSIAMPDGVTSIGANAFSGCTGLETLTIGAGVTSIGDGAFWSCTALTSLTIPDGVESIGADAFSTCTGLETLTIGAGVTTIQSGTFYGCAALTSLTIPDGVTSIGANAFSTCTGLETLTIGAGVTTIQSGTFYGCTALTSLTIPDGVTSIGYNAFSTCTGLENVTIPDSVTGIAGGAFWGCSALTNLTIPDGVTNIGANAFSACGSLTSATFLGDAPTAAGWYIFDEAAAGFTVYIYKGKGGFPTPPGPWAPTGDHSTGSYKIAYLDWLYTVTGGKATITGYVGSGGAVTMPTVLPDDYGPSVVAIGDGAFHDCASLTSLTIPDGVKSIGAGAFSNCSALTSLTIPDSVTSIGGGAFHHCARLTSLTIPDGVTSIGNYVFAYCSALTSITIPDGVKSIGADAFSNCSALTSLTIGAGVTSIGASAFSTCSALTSITIPDGVTSIGPVAFYGCASLTRATFLGDAPTAGGWIFDQAAAGFTVYFHRGSTGFAEPPGPWAPANGNPLGGTYRTAYIEAPDAVAGPSPLDFGSLRVGASLTRTVTLANQGTATLTVSGVGLAPTGAGFVLPPPQGLPWQLAPGQSVEIRVRFAPAAVGAAGATLTIASDDPDDPSLEVPLGGTATTRYTVVPRPPLRRDGRASFPVGSTVPLCVEVLQSPGGHGPARGVTILAYLAPVVDEVVGPEIPATSYDRRVRGNRLLEGWSGTYGFPLATRGLGPGTYRLRLALDDGSSWTVRFVLVPRRGHGHD